jgi:hypothetical protein
MGMREPFAPTEHATAVTRKGQVAAEYEVMAHGRIAGETKVWSRGAFEQEEAPNDKEQTYIHVAFMLESTDNAPLVLELDKVALESVAAGDRRFTVSAPTYVKGQSVSPGGGETQVDLYFPMPPDVKPQQLDAFRVRWSVVSDGERYEQRTPFVEYQTPYAGNYYYYPYYDPYFYAPWQGGPWPY